MTILNSGLHPFVVLAMGASAAGDTSLLIQGGGTGSLEGDAGINWLDEAGGATAGRMLLVIDHSGGRGGMWRICSGRSRSPGVTMSPW